METGLARRAWNWLGEGIRLPMAAAPAVFAVYGLGFASPYELRTLSICGIYAVLVLGFQFIFGHAGAVSLAQATFFGLGAYVTGILGASYGLGALVTFPLSCLLPTGVALVIAIPVLKLEEHYFALATMGIGLVAVLIATQWQAMTGGTNGLPGVPPIGLFGLEASSRLAMFVIVWVFAAAGGLIAFQITRGLYGRAFHVMRENHTAAASMGIDVAQLRFNAFLLSAAYGGAAGALMAHLIRVVSPENLELPVMVTCLTMTVIGGRTRIAGAFLGAGLIIYLREWFRVLENYYLMAYGAAALAVLIVAPYGLIGALERLRERLWPSNAGVMPAPAQLRLGGEAADATAGTELLAINDVVKTFGGVSAVDGVSLTIAQGEIVGLIGPNGSGKTTLLNTISGLYVPDQGSIVFRGREIADWPAHMIARLGMARTFQHINLADDLTVLDNIAVARFAQERAEMWKALKAIGRDPCLARARAIAMSAADLMGVADVALQPCGSLAYGTRRRVEVARSLASAPRLLLLDEPAAGLNEEEQRDFANRIRASAAQGVTVLVIEHNLVFLKALVGRMICLDRGRIIASGTPEDVQRNEAVIEAYLGRDDAADNLQPGGQSARETAS